MGTHRVHRIRVALQEKRNRVREVNWKTSGDEIRFFCSYVRSTPPLSQIVDRLQALPLTPSRDQWASDLKSLGNSYKSEEERAAYFWFFLSQQCQDVIRAAQLIHSSRLGDGSLAGDVRAIWECILDPLYRYLDDQLDRGTEALDLLERYVRRVEMFTGKDLFLRYKADSARSEETLTDDLKLYLYDGGIECPISPKSSSGIADIGAELESENAILLEVKIVDPERQYGKGRVLDGVRQIAAYTRTYSKPMGYLVVFVVGNVRVHFADIKDGGWPPAITHDGRKFFLVTVQMWGDTPSASISTPAKEIEVTSAELLAAIAAP